MAKTKEELNQLKKEFEILNTKLKDLSDDELKQVTGGYNWYGIYNNEGNFEPGSRLVKGNGKEYDEQLIK